jgi:hypothetical protein
VSHPRKTEHRRAQLEDVRDEVDAGITGALARGIVEPTALVVEREDRLARTIAEGSGRPELLAPYQRDIGGRVERTVILSIMPWRMARGLLAGRVPERPPLPLEAYPLTGYLAIVVAAGGIAAFALPGGPRRPARLSRRADLLGGGGVPVHGV